MGFRTIALILFLTARSSWCVEPANAKNVKKEVTNNSTNSATVPPTVPLTDICEKCKCTENSVKCSTWDTKTTFQNYKWPNGTMEVFSLENTPLVNITQFPLLSIKKLVITGSKIKKIDNKSFINLSNFTELDLSHNDLSSEILQPDAFEIHLLQNLPSVRKYLLHGEKWIIEFGI